MVGKVARKGALPLPNVTLYLGKVVPLCINQLPALVQADAPNPQVRLALLHDGTRWGRWGWGQLKETRSDEGLAGGHWGWLT